MTTQTPPTSNSRRQRSSWLSVTSLLLVLGLVLALGIFLFNREQQVVYETVTSEGGVLTTVSGASLVFPQNNSAQQFRVRFQAIPRSALPRWATDNNQLPVVEQLPESLVIKSPYYFIEYAGPPPPLAQMELPLLDIENSFNLDLYTWDGQVWQWHPSIKDDTTSSIRATLTELPIGLALLERSPQRPNVAVEAVPAIPFPNSLTRDNLELLIPGTTLGSTGRLVGRPIMIIPSDNIAKQTVLIRNWQTEDNPRVDLINNLLLNQTLTTQHVDNIVTLIAPSTYDGVELDYRGISTNMRSNFVSFLTALRDELPADKSLAVRVDWPEQEGSSTWNTTGYDWQAIGQTVDVVKIPPAPDPRGYVAGGPMSQRLDWAVSQVDRRKLHVILSTNSVRRTDESRQLLTLPDVFETLDTIAIAGATPPFRPGDELIFSLTGEAVAPQVQFDSASGLYWFSDVDEKQNARTTFIENGGTLSRKLQLLTPYRLGGISLQDISSHPAVSQVINELSADGTQRFDERYTIVWQVLAADSSVVSDQIADFAAPNFRWTIPQAGIYQVSAILVSSRADQDPIPLSNILVTIGQPTPTPLPTPSPLPTATASPLPPTATTTATPRPTATATPQQPFEVRGCANPPTGEFAALWQANPDLLGCPIEPSPLTGTFSELPYERGQMLWWRNIDEYSGVSLILTLTGDFNEGSWSLFTDTWNGEPICGVPQPPSGLFLPDRNLAKVWCENNGPEALGYATIIEPLTPERGESLLHNFDNVIIFRDARGTQTNTAYILDRNTNRYERVEY